MAHHDFSMIKIPFTYDQTSGTASHFQRNSGSSGPVK